MNGRSLASRPPAHLAFKATLAAIVGWLAAYALGNSAISCFASGCLAGVCLRIAAIDLRRRRIFDLDLVALAVAGLTWLVWTSLEPGPDFAIAALRSAAYAGALQAVRWIYRRIRSRDGLGFGDVKLAGAIGALLPIEEFAWVLIAAALAGIVFIKLRAWHRGRHPSPYTYLPFGALLGPAAYLIWFARQLA